MRLGALLVPRFGPNGKTSKTSSVSVGQSGLAIGQRCISSGQRQRMAIARAIHFGDLNLKESDVSQLRRAPQHYALLAELNTRPRTTYLKRIYESDEKSR